METSGVNVTRRDMSEIEVTCMWPGIGGKDFLGELESVGVGQVVIPMMGKDDPVNGCKVSQGRLCRAQLRNEASLLGQWMLQLVRIGWRQSQIVNVGEDYEPRPQQR